MREEISIASVVAYCVKKWKGVLVGMLVGCMLLGAYQGYKQYKAVKGFSAETAKAEYESAYEQYVLDVDAIDQKIARAEMAVEITNTYLDESYYMTLDANNLWVSVADLVITVVNDEDYLTTVEYNTTPESYIISKIWSVYLSKWETVDTGTIGKGSIFEYGDKYIREVVSVDLCDGGIIRVEAFANSKEDSELLVNSIVEYLLEQADEVSKVVNEHTISVLACGTNLRVDDTLLTNQTNKTNALNQILDSLASLNAEKDAVQKPVEKVVPGLMSCLKQVMKYALVGVILGGIVACIGYAMGCILADKTVASKEISTYAHIKYLGNLQTKMNAMGRLAIRIMGDRLWNSGEDAINYVIEGIKEDGITKKITLISTMMDEQVKGEMGEVGAALRKEGYEVEIYTDALRSVKMLGTATDAGEVVLLEKSGNSKLSAVVELTALCEAKGRKILGFVMIQ